MANKVEALQLSNHLAQTTAITFNSKATVKIRDNYFSFEFSMTRQVPFGADEAVEIKALTDDVNVIIDDQIAQILSATNNG